MGMLGVVFNIEAENCYSKFTFIATLIKEEKLVFILVIFIHLRLFVFLQTFFYGYLGIRIFPISVIRFPK